MDAHDQGSQHHQACGYEGVVFMLIFRIGSAL